MRDPLRINQDLLAENSLLKKRIQELEKSEAERKSAEEALRKSDEILRLISENMSDMIRVTDFQGNNLYYSPSHYKSLGYKPEERIGKTGFDIVHPDDLERLINMFAEGRAAKHPGRAEYRVRHADGHYVWLATVADLVVDDRGEPIASVMSSRNITDQKMIEDALRESEEKYRTIIEQMAEGYFEFDLAGTFTFVNDALCRRLGYPRKALIGKNGLKFTEKEKSGKIYQVFNQIYKTGKSISGIEDVYTRKDGSKGFAIISASLIRNAEGKPVGFQCISHDITSRKQAEDALRESEEKYRTIIEQMVDGYFEVDLAGNYTFLNEAESKIIGYSKDECIGTNTLRYLEETSSQKVSQFFRKLYKSDEPVKSLEVEIIRKDKTKGFNEISGSVIRDAEGKPIGFRGFTRDITDRKRAEASIRESEKRYRMIVENMHDAITTLDMNFKGTYTSPSEFRLTGYTPEEAVQLTPEQVMTPESRAIARKVIEEEFAKEFSGEPVDPGRSVNMDLEVYHKKGHTVWHEVTASFNRDENGKPEEILLVSRDITERKKMEAALRKSEEKYRMIVENMRDAIWTMDMNLNYTFISPSEVHTSGYTPEEAVLIPVDKLMTPESFARATEIFAEELERESGGQPVEPHRKRNMEMEVYHKNGGTIWQETTASFIRDENGKPTGIIFVGRDITERKKTEEALKKKEETLRLITDNMSDMISVTNFHGVSLYQSPSHFKKLGYRPEERQNKPLFDIVHPDDIERCINVFSGAVTAEQPVSIEFRVRHANGHYIWLESVGDGLRDSQGVTTAIIVSSRDISDRKQAEAKLQQSEENYRSIFENAHEGIFRTTPEGRFLMANQAMARMLGYDSPEELMEGMTDIAHQFYVHPEDRAKAIEIIEQQGFTTDDDLQVYRKNGSTIWIFRTMRAIRDENGQILYFEGLIEDITDRKNSFNNLRKALGGTVQAIASLVESKDPYTAGHQRRVADLARTIAREMGISHDQIEGIRMAGVIHDIGKISVPAEILSTPRRLTAVEFSLIKTHAQSGYDILKDIEFPWPVARMVLEHHERMNGSGYPNGLTGDNILVASRILSVADVVEAMATHRPYRPALGIDAALEEITRKRGLIYDADAVDACLHLFKEKGYKII